MAKVRPKPKKPTLDMTPVVDLAFLLVTFFMLTTNFRPEEPVIVDIPSSVSDFKIPETNIMVITIAPDGRVVFNIDNKGVRSRVLEKMDEKYNIGFTNDEKETFSNLGAFGMPIADMKAFLNAKKEERKELNTGIPIDSLNNQLADWVINSRMANPKFRIAIKGDGNTPYPVVKKVVATLQDQNINRFNLITSLEEAPKSN